MSDYRMRPKGDYLHKASLEELYALTEQWEKDLDFFHDELTFMRDVISRYFIWITKEDYLEEVQGIVQRIQNLETQRERLHNQMTDHLEDVHLLLENPFSHDEMQFRNEHQALEDAIALFVKDARALKQAVFHVTRDAWNDEKLHHLLAS